MILGLALISGAVSFINTFQAAYQVQRRQLIENTLAANQAYAEKLAEVSDLYIESLRRELSDTAERLAPLWRDADQLGAEIARLPGQRDGFNATAVIDAQGQVLASSGELDLVRGQTLTAPGLPDTEAAKGRGAYITEPYRSAAGKLMIALRQPVRDGDGRYLGFVGGALYLRQGGGLDKLLGRHYYRDGSYIYVVDGEGRVIHHHDATRLGVSGVGNPAVDAARKGQSGAAQVTNHYGVDMLAGYAPMRTSGWAVAAQRPRAVTLEPLNQLMWRVVWLSVPVALLSLFLIYLVGRRIARPLSELANAVDEDGGPDSIERVAGIDAWYFEAARLKQAVRDRVRAMSLQIGSLTSASRTDPLTGLGNRRALREFIDRQIAADSSFALLALDLDHFKRVNDTYGHAAGDAVLVGLATVMREGLRPGDGAFRQGGEEFLIALPDASAAYALGVAERIRARLAAGPVAAEVPPVTVSIGGAVWTAGREPVERLVQRADEALYTAKEGGRNRVVMRE